MLNFPPALAFNGRCAPGVEFRHWNAAGRPQADPPEA